MKRMKLRDVMTDRLKEVHDFATRAHDGQTTIGSNKHFMLHLASCAEIGAHQGLTETQLMATLLKDTLKLTEVRLDQVKNRFGIQVSELVKSLSMDQEWTQITDISVVMIKIAEQIDLLGRLDSARLGLEYKCGVLADARRLLTDVKPLAQALSLIDPDLSILDILDELQVEYDKALEVVDVEEEVV
jgi:hypothetical protein